MKRGDDPFDDIFSEIEKLFDEMMGQSGRFEMDVEAGPSGYGADTHVDIHETEDDVRVIADLPGVEKSGIELQCDGEVLTIRASSERREYDERVRLPARVDEHSATATYNNGILEVAFDRDDDAAHIDVD